MKRADADKLIAAIEELKKHVADRQVKLGIELAKIEIMTEAGMLKDEEEDGL